MLLLHNLHWTGTANNKMSVIFLLNTPVSEFHSLNIVWTQLPLLQVPLGVAYIVAFLNANYSRNS